MLFKKEKTEPVATVAERRINWKRVVEVIAMTSTGIRVALAVYDIARRLPWHTWLA
jgi:hypothetical protein